MNFVYKIIVTKVTWKYGRLFIEVGVSFFTSRLVRGRQILLTLFNELSGGRGVQYLFHTQDYDIIDFRKKKPAVCIAILYALNFSRARFENARLVLVSLDMLFLQFTIYRSKNWTVKLPYAAVKNWATNDQKKYCGKTFFERAKPCFWGKYFKKYSRSSF